MYTQCKNVLIKAKKFVLQKRSLRVAKMNSVKTIDDGPF